MINELYELSRSLEHHDLLQSTTHPDVGNVGKGQCLLIELDDSGIPQGVRFLPQERSLALWKHSKGNHNSFPAIRVQKPLLSVEQSRKIDRKVWKEAELTEKIQILAGLDYSAINPECDDIKISEWSVNELKPVELSSEPELAALKKLLSVFPREGQHTGFLQAVIRLLVEQVEQCGQEKMLDFIKKLLVGEEKNGRYSAACMTYYDMYKIRQYENLVVGSETPRALIRLLNQDNAAREANTHRDSIISPLSGVKTAGIGVKYPNPNLPLLGLTYLYSKKSDTPCLTRYGMTGAQAFQAGKDEINQINDALAFLTNDARKNKTWRAMSDSNHEKPNLLLAYLPDYPENDACLAEVLSDPGGYDDREEYQEAVESAYDVLCRQVLSSTEDIRRKNPATKVNLILLETLDPGRKQVVYENSFSAERLSENLITWADASKNYPPGEIRIWKKKEVISLKPICPGPSQISILFKTNYTRSGSGKPMKHSEVSLHEIYSLYMPGANRERAEVLERFLSLTVEKAQGLLGDIAGRQIKDYALPSTKRFYVQAKQAGMFVSLLSILLDLAGIRKENYMLDAPFNVGQFLKLADMLHKEYSVQFRNKGNRQAALPSQLMGNAMLAIAAENPVEGLNRLGERMKIYVNWAHTAPREKAGWAKWILGRFEEVSAKIAAHQLPEQFTPAEQAQVLLGYMAAIPYEKKAKDDEVNIKEDNTNE